MRSSFGILALLLTPPGTPSGGFHWQRTVTPPPGAPTAQACFVLDAATFANAAPALRDLRLFQDGTELPYVIEESYDPRALSTGTTPDDDRSLYEPVAEGDLGLTPVFGVASGHLLPDPRGYGGWLYLPAHVPVERLRLDRSLVHATEIDVQAGSEPEATERIHLQLLPDSTVVPVTIGANLQSSVDVAVAVLENRTPLHWATLEMRRRSLCYQPRSAAPLTLYLGGGPGMAAKTYNYASNFSTALDRPYATLGPLVPNPDDATDKTHPADTRRKHLLWAASLAAAFFVFSASRMLKRQKRAA